MLKWSISLFSMEHQKYILPKYGQPLYFSEERCVGKKNIKPGKIEYDDISTYQFSFFASFGKNHKE